MAPLHDTDCMTYFELVTDITEQSFKRRWTSPDMGQSGLGIPASQRIKKKQEKIIYSWFELIVCEWQRKLGRRGQDIWAGCVGEWI